MFVDTEERQVSDKMFLATQQSLKHPIAKQELTTLPLFQSLQSFVHQEPLHAHCYDRCDTGHQNEKSSQCGPSARRY